MNRIQMQVQPSDKVSMHQLQAKLKDIKMGTP